jgi:hypothetical protein
MVLVVEQDDLCGGVLLPRRQRGGDAGGAAADNEDLPRATQAPTLRRSACVKRLLTRPDRCA